MTVHYERRGRVAVITIDRPERENAVNFETARQLFRAFRRFNCDDAVDVAVLTGAGGNFSTGIDLQDIADGKEDLNARFQGASLEPDINRTFRPMGPTGMALAKPVIAAIEGRATGGGLELALWCDLRVAAEDAVLSVGDRKQGLPLTDGGTTRLPRLIGEGRALDLILTRRTLGGLAAKGLGLVEYLAEPGQAFEVALGLAEDLAAMPQAVLHRDRDAARRAWGLGEAEALADERERGREAERNGDIALAARSFTAKGPR